MMINEKKNLHYKLIFLFSFSFQCGKNNDKHEK